MLDILTEPFVADHKDSRESCDLVYLEAKRPVDATSKQKGEFKVDRLSEADVHDWAWQKGHHQKKAAGATAKESTHLRILFVQPRSHIHIPNTLLTARVLEALGLPGVVYPSYQQPSGVHSLHTYPPGSSLDDCTRIALVFRTPQKWECSMGGIAVAHDYESGDTTALSISETFGLHKFVGRDEEVRDSTLFGSFIQAIENEEGNWQHPLLLPTLFLVMHTRRVRSYVMNDLSNKIIMVERSIGITRAGRSRQFGPASHPGLSEGMSLIQDGRLQRDHAQDLTRVINDLSTWIIFSQRSPQWDIACGQFLRAILQNSDRLKSYRGIIGQVFRETLDYVINYSEASLEVTQSSEKRMQLQLNILYTSVAQDDARTSALIAVAAGKDSTSMKILALIAAAFLPATFVATLFSMGMFEWRSDGNNGNAKSTVSPDFWMYWAVAIPLTVVTLAVWAIWWKVEEHRLVKDVPFSKTNAKNADRTQSASEERLQKLDRILPK